MKTVMNRTTKRALSIICIICIMATTFSFAEVEKIDIVEVTENSEIIDVDVQFPNGITLNTTSLIEIKNYSDEQLIIDFPNEIQLSKHKSSRVKLKQNETLIDNVLIKEVGKFVISIKSKSGLSKSYYINITEDGTFYGENKDINQISFSNVVSTKIDALDSEQVSFEKVDKDTKLIVESQEQSNRSSDISSDAIISKIYMEVLDIDTKISLPKVEEKLMIEEKNDTSKLLKSDDSKDNISMAVVQSVFVTADSVTCSSPAPYLINTEYPVVCTYTNYEYTDAMNVPVRISINGYTQYSTTKTVNARSRHTLILQLTTSNANTNNVLLEIGEPQLLSSASKSMLISESIGKNLEYYVLDTPNHVAPYEAQSQITLRSFLQNTGTVDTDVIPVDFYFDNVKQGTYQVRSMTPGEKLNVNFNFINNVEGSHTVKMVIDPNHIVTSKNLEKSLTAIWNGTGPDLTVTEHTAISGSSATVGESNDFRFSVSNIGTKSVESSINGKVDARNMTTGQNLSTFNYSVPGLAVDAVNIFNYSRVFSEEGNWDITAEIDSTSNILESNESNNQKSVGVTITSEVPIYRVKWFSKLTPNFNVDKLDTLFFTNAGSGLTSRTPFEWDDIGREVPPVSPYGTTHNRGLLNKYACTSAALASVMNTLGATTIEAKYDFRTDTVRVMNADPVSIIWANIGFPTEDKFILNSTYNTYEMQELTTNPTILYSSVAGAAFGKDVNRFSVDGKTQTEKKAKLDELLALHPEGVIVRFSKWIPATATVNGYTRYHSIVFINNTGNQSGVEMTNYKMDNLIAKPIGGILLTPEIEKAFVSVVEKITLAEVGIPIPSNYIISENATTQITNGDYVPFNTCWTSTIFSDFNHILYIDVVDPK